MDGEDGQVGRAGMTGGREEEAEPTGAGRADGTGRLDGQAGRAGRTVRQDGQAERASRMDRQYEQAGQVGGKNRQDRHVGRAGVHERAGRIATCNKTEIACHRRRHLSTTIADDVSRD